MSPAELLKTIYLGDRGCTQVILDGPARTVKVCVDCISRIRSATGQWDYYTDEDIPDGRLVFGNVESFILSPPGPLPNDYINSLELVSDGGPEVPKTFRLSIGHVDERGASAEIIVTITAGSFFLEDPRYPGKRIVD